MINIFSLNHCAINKLKKLMANTHKYTDKNKTILKIKEMIKCFIKLSSLFPFKKIIINLYVSYNPKLIRIDMREKFVEILIIMNETKRKTSCKNCSLDISELQFLHFPLFKIYEKIGNWFLRGIL